MTSVTTRREFIGTLAGAVLAAPLAAEAQQTSKSWRLGFLSFNKAPPDHIPPTYPFSTFRQALRELGYVEGRNIAIEARWADLKREQLPVLAEELVSLKVDVIVTAGDSEVRAAMQVTHTIPVVMAVSGDPVRSGYVASLSHPGGNVTGLSYLSSDLGAKLLDLVKQTVPRVFRIAVLWNAGNPVKELDFKSTQQAARTLGLRVHSVEVRGPADFDRAFAAIVRERPDAVVTLPDEFMFHRTNCEWIARFIAISRVPTIFGERQHVVEGGLMSYGPSSHALFARAATYVDKILKGARPADLPVEQPTKFELVINLKAAKALGLTIPQSVLGRADEVIQ